MNFYDSTYAHDWDSYRDWYSIIEGYIKKVDIYCWIDIDKEMVLIGKVLRLIYIAIILLIFLTIELDLSA